MHHVNVFAPISYWKKLDEILRRDVPCLYQNLSQIHHPGNLDKSQMFTASMILNNIKLVPKNPEMQLPVPDQHRNYTDLFERNWEQFSPNVVIGPPEIKTCGNHRLRILSDNFDFVAWKHPNPFQISYMIANLSLEPQLKEFFDALTLFQRTSGGGALDVCDYYVEQKFIKIANRYIASKEEYEYYWNSTQKCYDMLIQTRKENYWCIWCYQTFMGLTVQGLSKDLLLDQPHHIPQAMYELIIALKFIQIPLYYITKTIQDFFGKAKGKEALLKYTAFANDIFEKCKTSTNPYENFELALFKQDYDLIQTAKENYDKDMKMEDGQIPDDTTHTPYRILSRTSGGVHTSSYSSTRQDHYRQQEKTKVLYGSDGKIFRKVDPETGSPVGNLADFVKPVRGGGRMRGYSKQRIMKPHESTPVNAKSEEKFDHKGRIQRNVSSGEMDDITSSLNKLVTE